MINSFDVKAGMTNGEKFFSLTEYLNYAKANGADPKDTLAKIFTCAGDIFANTIEQGKQTEETIESFESHLTPFISENRDKYFPHPHKDLNVGAKSALESIDFAKQALIKRNEYSHPVMGADSYERSFRRLG